MSIVLETRGEIRERLRAVLKALRPEILTSGDTDEGAMIETVVEAVFGQEVNVKAIATDVFPTTAAEAALLEHAKARLGSNPRKGATVASGTDALRITGTAGTVVDLGETLVHSGGTRYKTTESGTIGAGGTVDVDVESIDTGTQCNLEPGEELLFESPPAGVQSTAEIVVALTGGENQEDIEDLRVRLLHAFQSPPAGGRMSDYWAWAMAVTGVEHAYVYGPSNVDLDGRRGLGTIDVAVLKAGSGAARIPGADLVAACDDAIEQRAPTSSDWSVLIPGTDAVDMNVQLEPEVGYEWDWTGSGVVQSWDSGNKRITWTTAIPASLTAAVDANGAARIMLNGEVLTVVAYGSNTTDVSETPASTPANLDPIYPGGPLSAPALAALLALFDSLGPARGTAADPESTWDDELRVARCYDVVMDVTGVRDCVIASPATNVVPTDHGAGGTVDLLVPGEIWVRPL